MKGSLFSVGLALALATAPAGAADAPTVDHLDQTQPNHFDARHDQPLEMQWIPPRTWMVMPRMVFDLPGDIGDVATLDRHLSDLCRRMAFVQKTDRYFWARTKTSTYGVAFPTGGSLTDGLHVARENYVYFFARQDSTCAVYAARIPQVVKYYKP